jgi:hypothetical protein
MTHQTEHDLILYYYGEGGRRRHAIERHLDECGPCAAAYRQIAETLALVAEPEIPERGDRYGLEVWQRIRHRLPDAPDGAGFFSRFSAWTLGLSAAGALAVLLLAAFLAGRGWQRPAINPAPQVAEAMSASGARDRILLASVAEHLDRSDRVLTEILNTPSGSDISAEQRRAEDLLTTSRLYRQDAMDAGEQSVANILDELERTLVEIVHSPSQISAADLEQLRRRVDAAALLFKVRVMSDDLRRRDEPGGARPRPASTRKTS